jgi:uncharacterized protein involved in exopolysaccharide biosynthesis
VAAVSQETTFSTPREVITWLRSLVSRVARRWKVIAVALGVGVVFGALTPFLVLKPVYTSQVLLLYREGIQASSVLGQQAQEESRKRLGPRLKDMLLSRSHLEKVVGEFGLYPGTVARQGIIEAVDELRRHITFKSHEDTFEIGYDGEEAQVVHDVTKRLGDALIEENARYRFEQAEATRSFLQAEEQRTAQELRGKEEALATFLAQHPEFAQDLAPGGAGPTAGAAVRGAQRQQAAGAAAAGVTSSDPRLQALERQAMRLRESINSPRPVALPTRSADPALTAAKQAAEGELASAQRDLADKQGKFTEQHPDVLAAKSRVRQAEAKLEQAIAALTRGSPAEPGRAAPVDEGSIRDQLRSVESAIAARRVSSKKGGEADDKPSAGAGGVSDLIVALETDWNRVNREAFEARERYNQIQDKLFKASILAGVEASGRASQMVVIDPAFKPVRPTKFGKSRVAASVVGVAFALGLIIALALALIDDRLYTERDLRSLSLGPVVHVIPQPGAKGS